MSVSIPIYVVSLERSLDRRAHMKAQLDRLGLAFEWIAAVDGASLSSEDLRALAGPQAFETQPSIGRAMTTSEIGCALTHAEVWRRVANSDAPAALVLEDDVDVHQKLAAMVQRAAANAEHADVVLFGHHSSRQPWRPGEPFDHVHGALTTLSGRAIGQCHRMAPIVEYAQGAYAYLVTPVGARKLLQLATPIRMPADTVTGYAATAGVRVFAVTPPCVVPSSTFVTTMSEPRPCPCRVCSAARLQAEAEGRAMPVTHDQCLAKRTRTRDLVRRTAGRVLLLVRQLGVRPGSFWAPPGLFGR